MDGIAFLKWIIIVNSIVLAVQSLRVVAVYSSVYSLSPKDWRKQLPLHVWMMALSFFIYVGTSTYYLVARQDAELIRIVLYGAAGFIAQYGLWNVLKYDRRRYSTVTNYRDPHIQP
jgi:hypothetical protein